MTDLEPEPTDRDKLTGSLTKVASVSIGDVDTMWVVRHYTGLGATLKYIEVHVIRRQQFLGRFEVQEKPTFEVTWTPSTEHKKPATEAEVTNFRRVRMLMLGMVDKVWT
jgi:hypothetical protein